MTVDEENEWIGQMESNGFRCWNDHPGYTLDALREMLSPFGLTVETQQHGKDVWFKISAKDLCHLCGHPNKPNGSCSRTGCANDD